MDTIMKRILKKIQNHKNLLLGGSGVVGVIALIAGEYSLAFLFIFPIAFFGVNDYLASKAEIPKYTPMSDKRKSQDIGEDNESQNYSSYRAELFNSIRNRKKK